MSHIVNKINRLKPLVSQCLEQISECRDNDKLLILKIWAYQNPALRMEDFTFMKFANDFLDGNYSDPESIRRCRQKLQEERPELRGQLWYKRHQEADETRKTIND